MRNRAVGSADLVRMDFNPSKNPGAGCERESHQRQPLKFVATNRSSSANTEIC